MRGLLLYRQTTKTILQQTTQGRPHRSGQLLRTGHALGGEREAQLAKKEVIQGEPPELGEAGVEDVGYAQELAAQLHLSLQPRHRLAARTSPVQLAQEPLCDEDLQQAKSFNIQVRARISRRLVIHDFIFGLGHLLGPLIDRRWWPAD
jgi:hypothetical protein